MTMASEILSSNATRAEQIEARCSIEYAAELEAVPTNVPSSCRLSRIYNIMMHNYSCDANSKSSWRADIDTMRSNLIPSF